MLNTLKRWWVAGLAAIIAVLALILWRKSSQINRLEQRLVEQKAKLEMQRLSKQYQLKRNELVELREVDIELNEELLKIEAKLKKDLERIDPYMSNEEIAAKFREIGLRRKQ